MSQKEVENHPGSVTNIRPFLDLYNWSGIEYPTVMKKNDFTLSEKYNPEIDLTVLHVDVNFEINML